MVWFYKGEERDASVASTRPPLPSSRSPSVWLTPITRSFRQDRQFGAAHYQETCHRPGGARTPGWVRTRCSYISVTWMNGPDWSDWFFLLRLLNLFHSVIRSMSISTLNRSVSNPFQRCIPISDLSPLCSAQMPLRVQRRCCDVKVSDLCKAGDDDTWPAGYRLIRLFCYLQTVGHIIHEPPKTSCCHPSLSQAASLSPGRMTSVFNLYLVLFSYSFLPFRSHKTSS